jgi:hypothetical protein
MQNFVIFLQIFVKIVQICVHIFASSSSESGSWENVIRNENATAIWQLQLQMMAIITAMAGDVKAFPVQFNENAAWKVFHKCGLIYTYKYVMYTNVSLYTYKYV